MIKRRQTIGIDVPVGIRKEVRLKCSVQYAHQGAALIFYNRIHEGYGA